VLSIEDHRLHGHQAAQPPCCRDDAICEEEFELVHRRQFGPEAFSEIHELRFAFAFEEVLAA